MRINDPGRGGAMTKKLSRRNWLAGVPGNTLARPADRSHARLRLCCIVVWIVALPVAAILGLLVAGDGLHTAAVQAHDRTPATAVLAVDAPKITLTANGTPVIASSDVAARWHAIDGSVRTGTVPATTGTLAGSTVSIWIDPSGQRVDPPVSSGAAVGLGLGVGAGSWATLGLALLLTLRLGVRALDRRRRADWDRDWERVAPIWLRQE
jgi:hypothetical protein